MEVRIISANKEYVKTIKTLEQAAAHFEHVIFNIHAIVQLVAPFAYIGIGDGTGFCLKSFEAPALKNSRAIQAGKILTTGEDLGDAAAPPDAEILEATTNKDQAPKAAAGKKRIRAKAAPTDGEAVTPKRSSSSSSSSSSSTKL